MLSVNAMWPIPQTVPAGDRSPPGPQRVQTTMRGRAAGGAIMATP